MERDGEDPAIMDLDHGRSLSSQLKKEEEDDEVDDGPPLKDDPKYAKYFKMLKMVSRCIVYLQCIPDTCCANLLLFRFRRVCRKELFRMLWNAMDLIPR